MQRRLQKYHMLHEHLFREVYRTKKSIKNSSADLVSMPSIRL